MDGRIRRAVEQGYFTPVPGRALWNCPILVPKRINGAAMDTLLGCLQALDEAYLRERPSTPWLYSSGCWYQREPYGQEQWLTIPYCVLRRDQGRGIDCEDAACWRAAELVVKRGESAKAIWTSKVGQNGKRSYHIRTKRGDGRVEDPSYALGMGAKWAEVYGPTHSIVDGDKY